MAHLLVMNEEVVVEQERLQLQENGGGCVSTRPSIKGRHAVPQCEPPGAAGAVGSGAGAYDVGVW